MFENERIYENVDNDRKTYQDKLHFQLEYSITIIIDGPKKKKRYQNKTLIK